jgi:hypothetical protein
MPTLLVPCHLCTWTVVRPGPGLECVSRLKYRNALCSHRHERTVGRPLGRVVNG